MGLDPLPAAQFVDGDLPAEPLQHYPNSLQRLCLASGDRSDSSNEEPGRLRAPLGGHCLTSFCLDISAPLSEVLYLIQGVNPTSTLSGFSTPSGVPFSLTTYSRRLGSDGPVELRLDHREVGFHV